LRREEVGVSWKVRSRDLSEEVESRCWGGSSNSGSRRSWIYSAVSRGITGECVISRWNVGAGLPTGRTLSIINLHPGLYSSFGNGIGGNTGIAITVLAAVIPSSVLSQTVTRIASSRTTISSGLTCPRRRGGQVPSPFRKVRRDRQRLGRGLMRHEDRLRLWS
jgi:hypothetical protein